MALKEEASTWQELGNGINIPSLWVEMSNNMIPADILINHLYSYLETIAFYITLNIINIAI